MYYIWINQVIQWLKMKRMMRMRRRSLTVLCFIIMQTFNLTTTNLTRYRRFLERLLYRYIWVVFRNFTKFAMLALKVYVGKTTKYIKRLPPVGIELVTSAIPIWYSPIWVILALFPKANWCTIKSQCKYPLTSICRNRLMFLHGVVSSERTASDWNWEGLQFYPTM